MAKDDQSSRQASGSSRNSEDGKPPGATSQDRMGRSERSLWLATRAQGVLGAYRRGDFADPESYLVQLGMVLEKYDDAVIEAVTSPITGIQRTCAFPPSLAEFVQFIEEHIRRATYTAQYDQRSREQLREREEFERSTKTETPEHRAAVVQRCKDEVRAKGFRFPEDKTPHRETPASVRNRFGLSQEQWDEIPDSPLPLPDAWQTSATAEASKRRQQ